MYFRNNMNYLFKKCFFFLGLVLMFFRFNYFVNYEIIIIKYYIFKYDVFFVFIYVMIDNLVLVIINSVVMNRR